MRFKLKIRKIELRLVSRIAERVLPRKIYPRYSVNSSNLIGILGPEKEAPD